MLRKSKSGYLMLKKLRLVRVDKHNSLELVRFPNMTRFQFLSFFTVFGIIKGITSLTTVTKHIICA